MKHTQLTLVLLVSFIFAAPFCGAQGLIKGLARAAATETATQATRQAVSTQIARQAAAQTLRQNVYAEGKSLTGQSVVTVGRFTPQKQVLAEHHSRYLERLQGQLAYMNLDWAQKGTSLPEQVEQIWKNLEPGIKNQTLRRSINEAIRSGEYQQAMDNLTHYYNLEALASPLHQPTETDFVNSVVAYMTDNPRKITLTFRSMLKSPLVDEELKHQIQPFINKPKLLVTKPEEFKALLLQIYDQYNNGFEKALVSPEVAQTTEIYRQVYEDLKDFVGANARRPSWNGLMPERELHNTVEIVMFYTQFNEFPYALQYIKRIKQLLQMYPEDVFSKEATLTQYEAFLAENGHAPRSMLDAQGTPYSALEKKLFDSDRYHSFKDAHFAATITGLCRKYVGKSAK